MSIEWRSLANFTLTNDWQVSDVVTTTVFRFRHNLSNLNRYQVVAMIALAAVGRDGIEIFSPQKISPKSELEIIQFPPPPVGWLHSLAVRQLVLPSQNLIQWSLSIDMPLYPILSTTNPAASTSFTSSSVTIDSTAAKKVVSANSERKELTIYNTDSKTTAYLDLVNTVTTANASFAIPPGQVYISDIHWTGEVWGITKNSSVSLTVREFV